MSVEERNDEEIEASQAPLIEHLIELRSRIIKSLLGFVVAFVISFFFANPIFNFLLIPYKWAVGDAMNLKLIYTAPQEFFFTQLKIGAFGGLFLAFICMGKIGLLAFLAIRKNPLFHLQSLIPVGRSRETSPAGKISNAPSFFKCWWILLSSCFLLCPDKLSTGSNNECIASTVISIRLATTFKSARTVDNTLINASASKDPIG